MKNEEYLTPFVEYLTEEGRSPGTISGYEADVRSFLKYIQKEKKEIKNVKTTDIEAYKAMLGELKLSVNTINRKLVGIKRFISFLNERYGLAISVRVKQEDVEEQYSLNDEELLIEDDYERLMRAVEEAGDIRTKAMFETMYYTGMRVSEMLQLRVDHIEELLQKENGSKVIRGIKGKGKKHRPIFIKDSLLKTLAEYLSVRKKPYSIHTNALFVGERGPISRQTPHTLMKKYAEIAGIDKEKAHVHNLRHLFGLRLADQGVPIQEIAKYMGHSSIDVTKIYLEKPLSYYAERINQL